MQSHLIFSLITKGKIVITVLAAAIVLCGCKREKQTVFTETVYASGTADLHGVIGDTGGGMRIYEEQPEGSAGARIRSVSLYAEQ